MTFALRLVTAVRIAIIGLLPAGAVRDGQDDLEIAAMRDFYKAVRINLAHARQS